MASLGYRIPSTIVSEESQVISVTTSSSRRRPCAIGLASNYKRVKYEEVKRLSASVDDALAYTNEGIHKIINAGSQKGLSDFKEGTHFQLIDGKISWLPKIYNKESYVVTDILTPINYNAYLGSGVLGKNATSGYAYISTSPKTIIGGAAHELPDGNYSLRFVKDSGAIFARSISVTSGEKWSDIVAALSTALAGDSIAVEIENGKIKFTSSTIGDTSSIKISDGVVNGLLAAISTIGTYNPTVSESVIGENATSGYAPIDISNVYIVANSVIGLAPGAYTFKVAVNGGTAKTITVNLTANSTWGDFLTAINVSVDIFASIENGVLRISSKSTGSTSTVALTEGDTDDLVTALAVVYTTASYGTGVAGKNAKVGYSVVSAPPANVIGGVIPSIAPGTYNLKVNANGTGVVSHQITISDGMTWTNIVAALNASSLGDSCIITIANSALVFTSKISGSLSSVSISDGDSNGLLAAISNASGTYLVNLDDLKSGENATAGYQELKSEGEVFSGSKMCNLPSGVYTLNVTKDGGSTPITVEVSITGPTQTWNSIINNANSSIDSGLAIALENSSIVVRSASKGVASSIEIAAGAPLDLIAALNNLTASKLVLKINAASYDRDLIESNLEFISGNSTYSLSLAKAVEEGDTIIQVSGDPADLELIAPNTVIAVENKTVHVLEGASYFVSYEYNRPDSDFYKVKIFNSYEAVKEDLGDDIPNNPLVMWAKLALQSFGNIDVAVVQVKSETKSNYLRALDAIKYVKVNDILPLTADADVQSYVRTHVIERSLPESKRRRMAYLGAPIGTPLGDAETSNSICGKALATKHERCIFINAHRGEYYYNDPDTGVEKSTIVSGAFIAAVIGAYRTSFVRPTTSLLGKVISGIKLLDEDQVDYYYEDKLTVAGSCSCFLVAPSASGGMIVIDDLTTDNSTIERNNIHIINVKDYIAEDISLGIDNTFKGVIVPDVSVHEDNMTKYVIGKFVEYKTDKIIAKFKNVSVKRNESKRDTYKVKYSFENVYTHKNTDVTFEIV